MRRILSMALGLGLLAANAGAQAPSVQLFKLITVKDEITIGVTAAEAAAFGSGPTLDALATVLNRQGQVTVWQYAVRKGSDGALEQAPLRRVAIFKADSLRLEPLTLGTNVKLVPPQ